MRRGVDLSNTQLLQQFRARYPYPRRERWATNRRRAARNRYQPPADDPQATNKV